MEIGPLSNQDAGQKPEGQDRPQARKPAPPQPAEVTDRIDISQDARTRLAELADRELNQELSAPRPANEDGLTGQDKLEEIRRRIRAGYYDDPEVLRRVVDRLADDIDL
jgi:hypothetical protein